MRKLTIIISLSLLIAGSTLALAYEGSDTESFKVQIHGNARILWYRNETVKIDFFTFYENQSQIEYHTNLEDSVLFNSTIMDQLPDYTPIVGVDWEINISNSQLLWKIDDSSIWKGSEDTLNDVDVTVVIYAIDDDEHWARDSITLTLINGGQNQGDPVYNNIINVFPVKPNINMNVSFWTEKVLDPISSSPIYHWDFGDGTAGTGQYINHSFSTSGWKTIQMWVKDAEHITDKISLRIEVLSDVNNAPSPNIHNPIPNQKYLDSKDIEFNATGTEDSDDNIIGFFWFSNLSGYIGEGKIIEQKLIEGNHEITLWVFDGSYNMSENCQITVIPDIGAVDTDNDGIIDLLDADDDDDGLLDIEEDTNRDGLVGHNETDPRNPDTDGDGSNDKDDAFPLDPFEKADMDNDGFGDRTDAFPSDPAASKDSDGDGYPDEWNPGKSREDSTTNLILDSYPFDKDRYLPEETSISLLFIPLLSIAMVIIVIIFGALGMIIVVRRREVNSKYPGDLKKYGKKAIKKKDRRSLTMKQRMDHLVRNRKEGKISHETYIEIESFIDHLKKEEMDLESREGSL